MDDEFIKEQAKQFAKITKLCASKLSVGWVSSPVRVKDNLQKTVFPSGVSYDVKTEAFRTEEVNELFFLGKSELTLGG